MTEPKAILRCNRCFGTGYTFKKVTGKQNITMTMTKRKCKCKSGFIEYIE